MERQGDDLTSVYFCQLYSCLKLNAQDGEGIPGAILELPRGGNPIACNEGQAARLLDVCFPLASPSWMSTTDIINHATHVPMQDDSSKGPPQDSDRIPSRFISFPI